MGHDHGNDAVMHQVEVHTPCEEQPGDVLVGGIPSSLPDAVGGFAQGFQPCPEGTDRLVIVDPGWVAHDDVHLALGQGHGPYQISGVVGPDVVAALGVELPHGRDGGFHGPYLVLVLDVVVVQIDGPALLDAGGYVCHQGVEGVGPVDQAHREDQLGVQRVVGLNAYLMLREHIAGAEAELQGVS